MPIPIIHTVTGSRLDFDFDVIIHGTNCNFYETRTELKTVRMTMVETGEQVQYYQLYGIGRERGCSGRGSYS
jgi:hypothetical protein